MPRLTALTVWLPVTISFLLGGCAQSELVKKKKQLHVLKNRYHSIENELLAVSEENAHLKKELDRSSGEVSSLKTRLDETGEKLQETVHEKHALKEKLKRLRENNYDLEMTYATLSDRIKSLKSELQGKEKELTALKKSVSNLSSNLQTRQEEYERSLASQRKKTENLKTEKAELARKLKENKQVVQKVRARNETLSKQAGRLQESRQAVAALKKQKRALEAEASRYSRKVQDLREKLSAAAAACSAADVALPAEVSGQAGDWELVKRIAAERFEKAKKGEFSGDTVDMVTAGVAGVFLFLLVTIFLMGFVLIRTKKRLRVAEGEVAFEEEKEEGSREENGYSAETEQPASGTEEEPQLERAPAEEALDKVLCEEPEGEAGEVEEELSEETAGPGAEESTVQAAGAGADPTDSRQERTGPQTGPGLIEPIGKDKLSDTEVIEGRVAAGKGAPHCEHDTSDASQAAEDPAEERESEDRPEDDSKMLGDLKNAINKKFQELLEE